MISFLAKRTFSALLTLLLISLLTFGLAHIAGDPAVAVAGKEASAADIERIRQHYGFGKPLTEQYLDWLGSALAGDFGRSFHYQQPVADMLMSRFWITFGLGLGALGFALLLSLPLGILAATRPGSLIDRFALLLSVVGQAMPTFWFALLLMLWLGLGAQLLPISGNESWRHFVIPVVALGYFATPALMRLTRAGMIDALESDYIRTARAKGLAGRRILFTHAFRNVMIPIVSISAVQLGAMLGGSIVIEQIFSLQGLGWLGYDATVRSDLPVIQAITLLVAAFYVFLTLGADVVNAALDPRLRVR